MNKKNMWGNFKDFKTISTPKKYLEEQAKKLYKATNYILEATVSTKSGQTFRELAYSLDIIAPVINNYQKEIIKIQHNLAPYPLFVTDSVNDKEYECADESNFLEILETILSSPKMRKLIESLITHSQE